MYTSITVRIKWEKCVMASQPSDEKVPAFMICCGFPWLRSQFAGTSSDVTCMVKSCLSHTHMPSYANFCIYVAQVLKI